MGGATYFELLDGLQAIVVDDGRSCAIQRAWLMENGALVAHTSSLAQAYETLRGHAYYFDLLLVDADAHHDWEAMLCELPVSCNALLLGSAANPLLMQSVLARDAGYISRGATSDDFVFSVYNLVTPRAPQLDRLAARGASLWCLPPQLGRVLHYNLWGYSDRDIADALSISIKTAQQYQDELRRKTGVKTKHAYLRRLLMLAGRKPLLPVTEETQVGVTRDRARMSSMRGLRRDPRGSPHG